MGMKVAGGGVEGEIEAAWELTRVVMDCERVVLPVMVVRRYSCRRSG